MTNIEIDPATGAPIIKNIADPTSANPLMPVVAMPTSSPGLEAKALADRVRAILAKPSSDFIVPSTTETKPGPPQGVMTVAVDAEVTDDSRHISSLYGGIKQALREGGGDTQQQAQTFEKIKELLESWSDS